MKSLKAVLPELAPVFGLTADALYSRQRRLVQMGLLEFKPGRGPGSGTPFTADSLSVLLISVLAAESLADLNDEVAALCRAKPNHFTARNFPRCDPKKSFSETLASTIELWSADDPQKREGLLVSVGVTRCWRGHLELLRAKGAPETWTYATPIKSRADPRNATGLTTTVSFELPTLRKIITPLLPTYEITSADYARFAS